MISTFYDFSMPFYIRQTDVNVPTERNKQKTKKENLFFVGILKTTDKKRRFRIRNTVYGYKDPDPYENVTDPEH
jgi:hypothetical protein